jgi:outer membrane receptor for ferrienterochelin and colicins
VSSRRHFAPGSALRLGRWACAGAMACASLWPRTARAQDEKTLAELSLQQLMQVEVVSASRVPERLADAPATVIVITREEIKERGYTELSQVFDDLPGMDVVRPYGDTYFKVYWRGYRNAIGEPFLILVDGLTFNHLYFNSGEAPLVAGPLANVRQIEVVYGPVSSVYGANAFMGVINIITTKDMTTNGVSADVQLTAGSNRTRIADMRLFYKSDLLRLSVSAHLDDGRLDEGSGSHYEYTKSTYYADRRLWGGFVDNPNLGGRFRSPHRNRALDLRLFLGGAELAAQYYVVETGYGVQYPGDKVQNNAIWARPEYSLALRQSSPLGTKVTSDSLLRYRRSDVSNDSYYVDGYFDSALNKNVAAVSYWQALNFSWTAAQDFEVRVSDPFSFNLGARYERKNLQKAYDLNGEASDPNAPGAYLPADAIDASKYKYPDPPSADLRAQNRITTEDLGAYLQSRYRHQGLFGEQDSHQLNFGVRFDHNSQYGGATTVRAGYVGRYHGLRLNLLYGEGFQEPPPRLLYGGWKGSGSDPDLQPERSRSIELGGSYTRSNLSALLGAYGIRNTNTLTPVMGGARNLGHRTVLGLDVQLQASRALTATVTLKGWAVYSRIFKADEKKFDLMGNSLGTGRIGDLANDKVAFGLTGTWRDHLVANVRGHFVGRRETVETNPIRSVDAYFTLDTNVAWQNLLFKGLTLSVTANNLLGTQYFHPGVREANAGSVPGTFDASGAWKGSGGFFSSLLPQPGRVLLGTLRLEL